MSPMAKSRALASERTSARLIVDTLGGRIYYETSEETGTTIRIEIPMDIDPSRVNRV